MNRASLDRHAVPHGGNRLVQSRRAIDEEELRPAQAAANEIVEHRAPGLGALPAHALDREQHLLAVLTHAEYDEERDRGRFAVEPHPHHRAVEDQPHDRLVGQGAGIPGLPIALHLAPDPAHRVLAHRPAEHGGERTAHPARVGAGKVAAGDQRVGRQRAALIGTQRLALPLRRRAISGVQPCTRDLDLHLAKGSHQRPRTVAVAVTGGPLRAFAIAARLLRTAAIARPRYRRLEFGLDHRFDEVANPSAYAGFDRIKPVVEKMHIRCRLGLRKFKLRGNARHGVVSSPALQRRMIRG